MSKLLYLNCLLATIVLGWVSVSCASAQLSNEAIVLVEHFEEIYRVDPTSGNATDLLNSPMHETLFGHHLAIVDNSNAYVASFDDLFKFNFVSGQLSYVAELPFTPGEITADPNGQLIAVDAGNVYRVNPTNGAETHLHTETFFAPSDAVVDAAGNVYLTEFHQSLGVLGFGGGFQKIGDFDTNMFRHLDLGPDGQLYLSTTFGASFYRVNPHTGIGEELDAEVFTFIDDLQVDAAGNIVFAGEVDTRQGVFRFDTTTQEVTTIVDHTTVNEGFFNPLDIAIFSAATALASADFDESGTVDAVDLAIWNSGFYLNGTGDADSDGDTDGADLLIWQQQFGSSAAVSATNVPEPATHGLLLACLLLAQARGGRTGRQQRIA